MVPQLTIKIVCLSFHEEYYKQPWRKQNWYGYLMALTLVWALMALDFSVFLSLYFSCLTSLHVKILSLTLSSSHSFLFILLFTFPFTLKVEVNTWKGWWPFNENVSISVVERWSEWSGHSLHDTIFHKLTYMIHDSHWMSFFLCLYRYFCTRGTSPQLLELYTLGTTVVIGMLLGDSFSSSFRAGSKQSIRDCQWFYIDVTLDDRLTCKTMAFVKRS